MEATNIKVEVEKKNGNSALATFNNVGDAVAFINEHAANLSGEKATGEGDQSTGSGASTEAGNSSNQAAPTLKKFKVLAETGFDVVVAGQDTVHEAKDAVIELDPESELVKQGLELNELEAVAE